MNLPNFLDNARKVNESIVSIDKRITVLEAGNTHDNQDSRIGKLEEAMGTLSSTFSSLKYKREKAFVGKEQRFMYVPKISKPKSQYVLKIAKTVNETKSDLHVESSEVPKVPIATNHDLEEAIVDASSLDNT